MRNPIVASVKHCGISSIGKQIPTAPQSYSKHGFVIIRGVVEIAARDSVVVVDNFGVVFIASFSIFSVVVS